LPISSIQDEIATTIAIHVQVESVGGLIAQGMVIRMGTGTSFVIIKTCGRALASQIDQAAVFKATKEFFGERYYRRDAAVQRGCASRMEYILCAV
jgi:hypothetical protein